MDLNQEYLVRTECMTYNHENYITDAMDGFVMQQTRFPVVSVIIDDASTDHTVEVIRQYLCENFDLRNSCVAYEKETDYGHVIFARHRTNENCYFAAIFLNENHYQRGKSKESYYAEWADTKYVALCEGDDYWTDPLKLQKQVDFLEQHMGFSMCFHAADVRFEGREESPFRNGTNFSGLEDREYSSTEVVSKWMVPTASIVYRSDLIHSYQLKHPEWLAFGDITLVLQCSHTGKIFGMSDVMSVYRIQPNSVTNNREYVNKTVFKLPDHYRCLRMNFPKVEKGPLEWSISHSYYVRMKRQSNLFKKFRDFVLFVWWDPKLALGRMHKIIARRK